MDVDEGYLRVTKKETFGDWHRLWHACGTGVSVPLSARNVMNADVSQIL